jgi:hypothetical protein
MRRIASVSAARRDRRIPESMAVLFVTTPDKVQELFRNFSANEWWIAPALSFVRSWGEAGRD